jgi:1-phosphofructokinase
MCNILTLTLNPAIDFNVVLSDSLNRGKVNRAENSFKIAGGKGINVASYLSDLGLKNIGVAGLLGLDNAHYFKNHFKNKSLTDNFIYFKGTTRENIKIIENKDSITTDINLESSYIEQPPIKDLKVIIENSIDKYEYYIFSGSIPKWMNDTIYFELGKFLKDKNKKVIVDTSGIPLKKALDLHPFAIKPNLDEFYEIFGKRLDFNCILKKIDNLIDNGIDYVLLTMGERGAIVANKNIKLKVSGKLHNKGSSVGAGDAFLAGFAYGIIKKYSLEKLAMFSTAVSLALIESKDRNLPDMEKIKNNYCNRIVLEELKTF